MPVPDMETPQSEGTLNNAHFSSIVSSSCVRVGQSGHYFILACSGGSLRRSGTLEKEQFPCAFW